MADFSRLSNDWTKWSGRIGMANVSISAVADDSAIALYIG